MFKNKDIFPNYINGISGTIKQNQFYYPFLVLALGLISLFAFIKFNHIQFEITWITGFAIMFIMFYYLIRESTNHHSNINLRFKAKELLKTTRLKATSSSTSFETNFKSFINNNPDGICIIEFTGDIPKYTAPEDFIIRLKLEGFVALCNKRFAEMIEYNDISELNGAALQNIAPLNFEDREGNDFFEVFAESHFLPFSTDIRSKNSNQFYAGSIHCEMEQDKIKNICVQLRNLNSKQSETKQIINTSIYENIFNQSADGMILIKNEKITQANESAFQIFNIEAVEFIGADIQSILPLVQSDGVLSTDRIDELIKEVLNGKREISIFQFQRPSGSVFDAELQIQIFDEGDHWILLLSIRDITNREDSHNNMQKKVALEQLITSISTRFINLNPGQILREIQNAIKETARFLEIKRSYILLLTEDKSEISCISEFAAEGLDEIRDNLQRIQTTEMHEWIKLLSTDQIQLITSAELENSSSFSGRMFIESTEADIVLEIPIKRADSLMGVMGFASTDDSREWSKDEVTMLKTVAEIIGHSLERRKMEQALRYRSELEKLVSEVSNRFINIPVDKIDSIVNDALEKIMLFTESDAALLYQFSADMESFRVSNHATVHPEWFTAVEFRDMKIIDYKWWLSAVFENKVRAINSVEQIPESAVREREFSAKTGMNSGIDIPMVYQSKTIGVLSFLSRVNNRQWSDDEIALFRLISQVLTNALLRKDSEYKLRESEKSYRNIFENIRDIYYESTLDDIILEISPSISEVSKYSRNELIGRPFSTIYTNKVQSKQILSEIRKEKSISNFEIQIKSVDDKIRYLSINAQLINDENGKPAKIVGSMRDISKNKLLEEQLQQAQKMEAIGTLAGGVAHDFNNLLTAIIGGSDLLLTKLDENDPVAKRIKDIREAGEKASGLTRQLLAFSRKQVLEAKIINLNDLVNNLKKMLSRLISEDIDLQADFKCDNPVIKADPTQIEQVLINLVVNARDAMPKGGKIIISTADTKIDQNRQEFKSIVKAGEYVRLSVKDTGQGIKKEIIDKVFDPFFTTKDRDKGTGLGLAMVYGIIKQHGGYIWAESEEGNGTVFDIYLPKVPESKSAPEIHKPDETNVKPGNETVLVAEDDKNVQRLVSYTLSTYGYKVIASENVKDALEIARKEGCKIDLLLTDVIMPDLNGRQLYEEIRQICPDIRAIYMSGYNDEVISEKGFLKSDVKFIQKPFTITDLARKVREVLDE